MGLVPVSEWGRVDQDDGVFDQRFRSDQLVVASIVNYVQDTSFAGDGCFKIQIPVKANSYQLCIIIKNMELVWIFFGFKKKLSLKISPAHILIPMKSCRHLV